MDTARDEQRALGGCNIWDGVGVGWGCGGELLEEMTKGSSLSGGTQAIVLWHCAHEDPSQQSFESSVLTLIHYHH